MSHSLPNPLPYLLPPYHLKTPLVCPAEVLMIAVHAILFGLQSRHLVLGIQTAACSCDLQ